jgi:hypothetical protein
MSEREQPAGVDPSEQGNYEGVSGGETTAQSGDPDAEAARQDVGEDEPAEEAGGQ